MSKRFRKRWALYVGGVERTLYVYAPSARAARHKAYCDDEICCVEAGYHDVHQNVRVDGEHAALAVWS